MRTFFAENQVKSVTSEFLGMLNRLSPTDTFERNRNNYIKRILKSASSEQKTWDENTQYNIENNGDTLFDALKAKEESRESLDETFSLCVSFLIEYYINIPTEFNPGFSAIKSFASYEINKFSETAKMRINFSLAEMPISILKNALHSLDFKNFREFSEATGEAEKIKLQWDSVIKENLNKVKALSENLKKYESQYNFVGLYKGFLELSEAKKKECKSSKTLVTVLGMSMTIPIILETSYFILSGSSFSSAWDLLKIIPAASLTIITMYFFRIALKNHTSLKAQILQIELRKTLCSFVQSYADYSKEIKNKEHNPLEKFEDVVFSNIMSVEEKIPSTFDGFEHLASVISAFKSGRN